MLECKSRQPGVEILLTHKRFWPKAHCIKSYKNKRLPSIKRSILEPQNLINAPGVSKIIYGRGILQDAQYCLPQHLP